MKPIFRGRISKNALIMGTEWTDHLFTLEDQEVDVTIEKHRSLRSTNQNRYYWGVIVKMLSHETGYSSGEMHEILKGKFLSEEIKIGNDTIRYSKSTTDLKTSEFEELMTQIREWASVELNCYIPEPNEIEY